MINGCYNRQYVHNNHRNYSYSSKDLRVFKYSFNIEAATKDKLAAMSLLKPKIKRRGCSAGLKKKMKYMETVIPIRRIDNAIRLPAVCNRVRGINLDSLVVLHSHYTKYSYPKLLFSNCRSIRNKIDEIRIVMSYKVPDIAVFAESWLTFGDVDAFEINGYKAIHRVRSRCDKKHGGGVSIYIRNSISILSVNNPVQDEVEITTVLFRTSNMKRDIPFIALIAVYSPPNNVYAELNIDYIMAEIDRVKSINVNADILVIGDFNDLDVDKRLHKPTFVQLILQQTCNSALIDKCFYSGKIEYQVCVTAPISSSDHKLVELIPNNFVEHTDNNIHVQSRPRRNSCFRDMGRALACIQWDDITECFDFDTAVEAFHSLVADCYNDSFPLVYSLKKRNNKSWFCDVIKNAIAKRNLFYKIDITQYNVYNKIVKEMIRTAKRNEFNKFNKLIEERAMSFYDVVKLYSNLECENNPIVFPGSDLQSSIKKTASYYDSILNKCPPIDLDRLPAYLPGFPIKPVTVAFVCSQLRKVRANGSCAPDGIPNFILREYAIELSEPITKLMNRSLHYGYCPKIWKNNFLITIPKKKIISSPADLRPIVLSSSLVKILEKHIVSELLPVIARKMDNRQFGGFPGRSVEQYLTFYIDTVHRNLDTLGNRVTAVITDFNKAFDAVDHNILMDRLLSMDASPNICKWISSFLDNRLLIMKWNNSITDVSIQCSNGTPQGSVLGGLLFSVTINEVASCYDDRMKYVDDLTILCIQPDSESGVVPQQVVESLIRDSEDSGMSLNASKCSFMTHCFSRSPAKFDLKIGSQSLMKVDQCKIIGVIIQADLKWDAHIDSVVAKVNRKMYLLYRLKNVGMCDVLLTKAYYTYIRPCIEYCCVVWFSSLTKAQKCELERLQKRVVKLILGNKYVNYDQGLSQLGLTSLVDRMAILFEKFTYKFLNSYPEFKPVSRLELSGRSTRAANKLCAPKCRTTRYRNSPIPSMIRTYNLKH